MNNDRRPPMENLIIWISVTAMQWLGSWFPSSGILSSTRFLPGTMIAADDLSLLLMRNFKGNIIDLHISRKSKSVTYSWLVIVLSVNPSLVWIQVQLFPPSLLMSNLWIFIAFFKLYRSMKKWNWKVILSLFYLWVVKTWETPKEENDTSA